MTPTVTEDQIFRAMRLFLIAILPAPFDADQAQVNRVAEPVTDDFAMMTSIRRTRLRTNVDSYSDVKFTASIAGAEMTVTDIALGTIVIGAAVIGVDVLATVIAQVEGPTGGVGVYTIDPPQDASSQTLSAGGKDIEQGTQVTIQLDIHGPNSADNAQVVSTVMRDAYGVRVFETIDPAVVPLYGDDPRQAPFINDQAAYENRWVIECVLQVNPAVRVPQQFSDAATIEVISVDATFPP